MIIAPDLSEKIMMRYLRKMGENVIEHKCKNCGKWSIKWERTITDNFCSNCGVEMKGGEDE